MPLFFRGCVFWKFRGATIGICCSDCIMCFHPVSYVSPKSISRLKGYKINSSAFLPPTPNPGPFNPTLSAASISLFYKFHPHGGKGSGK